MTKSFIIITTYLHRFFWNNFAVVIQKRESHIIRIINVLLHIFDLSNIWTYSIIRLSYSWSRGDGEPIPADIEADIHTYGTIYSPINLSRMSLDWGGWSGRRTAEGTHAATCKPHTEGPPQDQGSNLRAPPGPTRQPHELISWEFVLHSEILYKIMRYHYY